MKGVLEVEVAFLDCWANGGKKTHTYYSYIHDVTWS